MNTLAKVLLGGFVFALTLVAIYVLRGAFMSLLLYGVLFAMFGAVMYVSAKIIFKKDD